jgi:alpha-1,2-glucosyltransferase
METVLAACAIIVMALLLLRQAGAPLLYDEVFHYGRIEKILQGTVTVRDFGVMFPGYHLVVAALLKLTGLGSVAAARVISLLLSLTSCVAAYGIARTIDRPTALLRTLQFALFPILLPFFPLLYTDPLSLAFLLFALLAAMRSRPFLLAIFFLLAVFVRQNNVLWAPLLFALLLPAAPAWSVVLRRPKAMLQIAWPLLPPVIVFLLFVAWTGRASLNPDLALAHPFPAFSSGNIFFTLFLFMVLFLPLVAARARATVRLLRHPSTWLLLVALFTAFSISFAVDHPANSEVGRLRDTILLAADAGGLPGFFFWLAGAIAVLTMMATPLARRSFLWIYPLSLLYLGGSWLIDPRYAIVPLVLFLLLRKPSSWRMDILQLGYNILLLLWVFW